MRTRRCDTAMTTSSLPAIAPRTPSQRATTLAAVAPSRARLLIAAAVLVTVTGAAASVSAGPQATDTLVVRGRPPALRLYGARGGPPVIVSSGDGGWVHLGPQVAEFLAARGCFVVGVDVKAYLSGFTDGAVTLKAEQVPGDHGRLVDYAARGATRTPLLIGVCEGAGLSVLAATDPALQPRLGGAVRGGGARLPAGRVALVKVGQMGKFVNLYEANTHLSELVDRAARGEEVVIAKAGQPRARLVPLERPRRARKPGAWKGRVVIAPDFDEPLPADVLAAFEGGS